MANGFLTAQMHEMVIAFTLSARPLLMSKTLWPGPSTQPGARWIHLTLKLKWVQLNFVYTSTPWEKRCTKRYFLQRAPTPSALSSPPVHLKHPQARLFLDSKRLDSSLACLPPLILVDAAAKSPFERRKMFSRITRRNEAENAESDFPFQSFRWF